MISLTAKQLSSPANASILEEIVDVYTNAFLNDASHKLLLGDKDHDVFATITLPQYVRFLITSALACDAIITIARKDNTATLSKSSTSADDQLDEPKLELNTSRRTIGGVAITIPPHGNAAFDSTLVALRVGALSLSFTCGFGFVWRLLKIWLPMLNGLHGKMFPDPATTYDNWHLFYVGVLPEHQGQGLGTKMLMDIQERVRQDNMARAAKAELLGAQFIPVPLYLEASSLKSRALYDRLGFQDMCTGTYGTIGEGEDEDSRFDDDGNVVGGRLYGMIWHVGDSCQTVAGN